MNKNLPKPPQNKLSSGKAVLLMMAVCTTYALLIPEDVLTRFPALTGFTSFMESLFPAIGNFARFSPIPEVVRLYYATVWLAFPLVLFWFLNCVRLQEGPVSPTLTRTKAAFFAIFSTLVLCLSVYLMAFHVSPAESVIRPVITGGRGNALVAGLTANPISIGIVSAWMLIGISLFFAAITTFINFIINPPRSTK